MTGNEAFAYGVYLNGIRVGAAYPDTPSTQIEVQTILESSGAQVKWIKATEITKDLGNPAMVRVVLLGALSNLAGGGPGILEVIKKLIQARFAEMNRSAFLAGRKTLLT